MARIGTVSNRITSHKSLWLHTIEEMRASLPIPLYLRLLHAAATKGCIPVLSSSGEPTGEEQDLTPAQRLEVLRFLTDKLMPTPKDETTSLPPAVETEALTTELVQSLSTQELQALLAQTEVSQTPPEPEDE